MLVEDGLVLSEIVGVGLLVDEEAVTLRWLMKWFKETNSYWEKTRVFKADKDLTERHVITECFSGAHLSICLFHTLLNFQREVTAAKMGISQATVEALADLFQSMAYSSNETQFQSLKSEFIKTAPKNVQEYFQTNCPLVQSG